MIFSNDELLIILKRRKSASNRVFLIIDEIIFDIKIRNLKISKLSLFLKPVEQLRSLNLSNKY